MVGGHGVQQAHAVFAGDEDLSTCREIQVACCFAKSFVTGSHIVSVLQIGMAPLRSCRRLGDGPAEASRADRRS
jgi:hypothetical protein